MRYWKTLCLCLFSTLHIHCAAESDGDVIISSTDPNPLANVDGTSGDVTGEVTRGTLPTESRIGGNQENDARDTIVSSEGTSTDPSEDTLSSQGEDASSTADVISVDILDKTDTTEPVAETIEEDVLKGDTADEDTLEGETDAGSLESPDAGLEADTEIDEEADFTANGPFSYSNGVENGLSVAPLGALNVSFYYPETDGTYPLVVFAPGFQLTAPQFGWVGEHLASHGYAVLIPTFGDNAFAAFDHVDLAAAMSSLLDEGLSETGIFNGQVDPEQLAMGGHSRGGKSAILAAINDPRVKAVITLDPVDTVGGPISFPSPENPSVTPELMGGLTVPTGFVGAGKGKEGFAACAPEEDNYHAYFVEAPSPSYEWLLPDAGHNDFAQNLGFLEATLCPSGGSPETVQSFSRGVMAAFLNVYLLGETAGEPWLQGDKVPSTVLTASK